MLKKILSTAITIISYTSPSGAEAPLKNESLRAPTNLNKLKTRKACVDLLNLEYSQYITEKQWKTGKLLYSMIEQVSDEPIEYCEYTTAAFIREREEYGVLETL